MRRRGVEDIKGATLVAVQLPKQPRRKVSKAELRQQAAAAFLAWRAGQTPATPADISLRLRFICLHERRRTRMHCDAGYMPNLRTELACILPSRG